ncbi:MAG: hypothetical protein RIQ94_1263 [Pseudomonadota bacterium]|jgi:integrase
MTGLDYAVDLTLIINGSIKIKPYQADLMQTLNSVHLWDHIGLNEHHKIDFGCEKWLSPANKSTLTFYGCKPKLAYQFKSLALGMYTQGTAEGMSTLAWNTICHIISNLKRFGIWIAKYGLLGFDELDHLDELKIRNIIREMVVDMKMHEHPSVADALLKAMYWTKAYQLISNPCVYQLMNEYLGPFVLLKKSRRNKHSIIPPRILKKLLIQSELQVEKAQQMFEPWSKIQLRLNQSISTVSSGHFNLSTYIDVLNNDEQIELDKYHNTINTLRRYTYILVLSYTGMRYSEALALSDDAAVEREGQYYLKTFLSKTTDETQCLE